jgi:hypothetical protein
MDQQPIGKLQRALLATDEDMVYLMSAFTVSSEGDTLASHVVNGTLLLMT